ncbi:NADH-quinone oxidoreductase subunit NuoE [Candidatus Curculioniphilus buchneri]|uniref:NADH-quinone oxidoreductase subunit NuoE n=1 Tax=Candidatus Curculioniphilus buchneri TaxID=690594 RepID=UPI00376EBB85
MQRDCLNLVEENVHTNQTFNLSPQIRETIKHEMHYYEDARSISIEALKIVQRQYGWVPDDAIEAIAQILGISNSDVEGVATFYSQIFRTPVGRHIIRFCDSIVCYITGYQNIQATLEKLLSIKPGQTTPDNRFTLLPVCCLGNCDKSPTMMIDEDTYSYLTSECIAPLLEKYR